MARTKMTVRQAVKALPKSKKTGTIKTIIALYKKGYDKLEIIAGGFNRNTVYRQTREYDNA